jgi:hypothetical protein
LASFLNSWAFPMLLRFGFKFPPSEFIVES